jgi:hypothetical protein
MNSKEHSELIHTMSDEFCEGYRAVLASLGEKYTALGLGQMEQLSCALNATANLACAVLEGFDKYGRLEDGTKLWLQLAEGAVVIARNPREWHALSERSQFKVIDGGKTEPE